jgi:dTDP-4-dehydrorhamnose reductase
LSLNPGLELWASPEPTVARIDATTVRDQLAETGHEGRFDDVALIADLGVAACRYPVLWEKTAPRDPRELELGWAEERLNALRARGVEPVVTLLHHGSGPPYTELLDPQFPTLLADYAERVARAFPWVRRWTPVNEPLTTARFSTLYGFWYPNRVDDHAAFGRAITNEILGILLAMERIRAVNPQAELVMTEDLQRFTIGDDGVREFVAHKRERMYLSAELLQGRVVAGHALYPYLSGTCNVPVATLRAIADRAAPPEIMGFNYYPNSERYLYTGEQGIENVPASTMEARELTPRPLLRAAYERLGLPLAITEIHLYGEETARANWLRARIGDAQALRDEGLPIVAAGAWAAFGMIDWYSVLRSRAGVIEDGVYTFAPAGERPRPTAVAEALKALTTQTPA